MSPTPFRLILSSVIFLVAPSLAAQDQPNIVFILVDDLGYGDLGAFWQDSGSKALKKFDTPGIDKMASEGVKLTHHYVAAPVCAPSRASLLSGRHQGHAQVRDSQFDKALPSNHTLATVLSEAGYATALIGKAGLSGGKRSVELAGEGSQALAGHPMKRGFDHFFGYHFHGDGHEHYPQNAGSDRSASIYDGFRQIEDASLDLYTTDAWTAAAKQFIIDEVADGDDQPFFVYLSYDTPHFKMQRPAAAYPPLDNDGDPKTGGVQWTTETDGAGRVRYASTATGDGVIDSYTHPDIPAGFSNAEKRHVGMIRRIDNAVADVLSTLKELKLDENTLVIFSSDNGPHNEGNNPRTFESFADMVGTKRDMWEAGIRVPTVVRWPAVLKQATQDENNIAEVDYPSAQWDWLPTFAQAAGVPAPAYADGVSLLPVLKGEPGQRDKGYLYFEFQHAAVTSNWVEFGARAGVDRGQMQTIRIDQYMGVRTSITDPNADFEIYDVVADPAQQVDLAAGLAPIQARMKALALNSRRPGGGVKRPYDGAAIAAMMPPATVAQGVRLKGYAGPFAWVPEFRDLVPVVVDSDVNFDAEKHAPDPDSGVYYEGFIQVPMRGEYTFFMKSDSGASLHLHDAHVIDDDFNHDGSEVSGAVVLEAGYHPYRLNYKHDDGAHELSLSWSWPGVAKNLVPSEVLFYDTATDGEPPEPPTMGGSGGQPNTAGGSSASGGENAATAGSAAGGGAPTDPAASAGAGSPPVESAGAGPDLGSAGSTVAENDAGCGCRLQGSAAERIPRGFWLLALALVGLRRRLRRV